MKHIFDVDIAKEYGVNEAVILESMNYWIQKNKANGKHFYEGEYWTYNSPFNLIIKVLKNVI